MKINIDDLSLLELDELIAVASGRREQLSPQVPATAPESPVVAVEDPRWYVRPVAGGTLFQIRHPTFGWLAFLLPPDSRAPLLKLLIEQALPTKSAADNLSPPNSSVH